MDLISSSQRSHKCSELSSSNISSTVILCGWVNKLRNLGNLQFLDLRDKYGITQLGFEKYAGDLSIFKEISLESVIQVWGEVVARPKEAINKSIDTGEIEVQVSKIKLLSKAKTVPFLPYSKTSATEDLKLKYRYLDLRTVKLQNILAKRSSALRAVRETLYSQDFVEVETPILYKSTPEGARDFVVPSRLHQGEFYALPQSPQTLKQLLMVGSTDRYFQIAKCFRDEDLRADRQPEFTQIDIEASFIDEEYIKNLSTLLMKKIFNLPGDFSLPVKSYDDCMRDYGSDKPDLRFGLKHFICNEIFKTTELGPFKDCLEQKGLIKAIFLPNKYGNLSRKQIDQLVDVTKYHKVDKVLWFKSDDKNNVSGGISKFINEETLSSLLEMRDSIVDSSEITSSSGLWIFTAATQDRCHAALDALRRDLGKKLNLIDESKLEFLWVNNFPLLEYDEETNRYYAKHHPFTRTLDEDLDKYFNLKDLESIRAIAYDLVCNGYELGGGSLRIYDESQQDQMFKILGMSKEEVDAQFGFFIEALGYGTPPHGGVAFGLDRISMILCKTDSIRDVIAFPKTTSATDLMAKAPSIIDEKQLVDLKLKIDK
jgi:aspartyl-tRNA synthetase